MDDKDYIGPERRKTTKTDIALMVEEAVEERVGKAENKLMNHMDTKFNQLNSTCLQHVQDAFPKGDVRGHKDHHQTLIENAEVTKQLKVDMISWLLKGGIGFVLFIIGIGALEWIKRELAK